MSDRLENEALQTLNQNNDDSGRSVILAVDYGVDRNLERQPVGQYVRQLFEYRHFIFMYARYKSEADNDEMLLGKVWAFLEPILRIAMYACFFGLILRTSRGIENFLGYLIIGIIFFSLMSGGLVRGSGLIRRSKSLIGTFRFPRATVVLAESLKAFLASLLPAVLAVVSALLFQLDTPVGWTVMLVVPLLVLIELFSLGLMFISARITAFLPDAKRMVQFVNRAWFYVSGVFFSIERYATIPELQTVMVANPAYQFLQSVRGAVMYSQSPSLQEWLILSAWSFGTLFLGFIFFWRADHRYVHVR